MDDLISRQAAIDVLHGHFTDGFNEDRWWNSTHVLTAIKSVPSAEPQERKTGRWIYGENDCQDGWYCSECKFFIPWDYDYYGLNNIDFIRDYHTCPHCDAKMLTYTGAKMEVEHDS